MLTGLLGLGVSQGYPRDIPELGTAVLPGLSAPCSLVGWNQSAGGVEMPWARLFPRLSHKKSPWKSGTLLGVPSRGEPRWDPATAGLAVPLFLWDTDSSPPLPTPLFPPARVCVAFFWPFPAEVVQDPPSHSTNLGHVPCQPQHQGEVLDEGFRQGGVPRAQLPPAVLGT